MWKSSPSGELTYFARSGSSSRSFARLEAAHPAARVGQREEQPPVEVVVAAAVDEPGRAQLLRREALLARLPREGRAAGREPEPVRAADLLAEPAAAR